VKLKYLLNCFVAAAGGSGGNRSGAIRSPRQVQIENLDCFVRPPARYRAAAIAIREGRGEGLEIGLMGAVQTESIEQTREALQLIRGLVVTRINA
jgi:hypothetical protein